jgi:signal transduction histidine kinase
MIFKQNYLLINIKIKITMFQKIIMIKSNDRNKKIIKWRTRIVDVETSNYSKKIPIRKKWYF